MSEYKLLHINENMIKALSKSGMNLSHYWVLDLLNGAKEVYPNAVQVVPQLREVNLLMSRFLVDTKGITPLGQQFYKEISEIKEGEAPKKSKKKEEVVDNGFEEWYCAYPSSDHYRYRGMVFEGEGKSLKPNKEICRMKYNAIIARGGITKEQILDATKLQIEKRKAASFDSGKNGLTYMQKAETYLGQESFRAFLEEINENNDELTQDNCWA